MDGIYLLMCLLMFDVFYVNRNLIVCFMYVHAYCREKITKRLSFVNESDSYFQFIIICGSHCSDTSQLNIYSRTYFKEKKEEIRTHY